MLPQRRAVLDDAPAITALMQTSIRDNFPGFYDEIQTASAVVHVGHLDLDLVTDGTYFVHEADGEIVACRGWSRRARQYAGDDDHAGGNRLLDPGTEPLYRAFGFEEIGRGVVTTPDGIDRGVVEMTRPVEPA